MAPRRKFFLLPVIMKEELKKILNSNTANVCRKLIQREITGCGKKFGALRLVIHGENAYTQMWKLCDYMVYRKEMGTGKINPDMVYIMPYLDPMNKHDMDMAEKCGILVFVDLIGMDFLQDVYYLWDKEGRIEMDISHKNVCFVSESCENFSSMWRDITDMFGEK